MKSLPIKNIPLTQQQPITKLVAAILSQKKENPSADTSALEKQIDKLVYKLYELTEAEIKIIEKTSSTFIFHIHHTPFHLFYRILMFSTSDKITNIHYNPTMEQKF